MRPWVLTDTPPATEVSGLHQGLPEVLGEEEEFR